MLSILHCTSNYPASDETVNLNAILTLKKEFNLPIGYSDHTEGIIVSVAAVAIGAIIVEKHFTVDQNLPGPDHRSSIDGSALKTLIADAQRISRCLGDGKKIPAKSEEVMQKLVRRSIVLTKDLPSGQIIKDNDIELLRPGNGISPKFIDKVLGSVLNKNKKSGDFISWEDLD
jgi:sialic acid synthase SpsE